MLSSSMLELQVPAPGLTFSRLQVHLQSSNLESVGRVRLSSPVSGGRVCLPAVSTSRNGWTVPEYYLVGKLCGTLVFMIGEDGSVDALGPQHRVSGVIVHECGRLAPSCYPLSACADENGWVSVVFGEHVAEFAGLPCQESGLMDLDGVKTPESLGHPFD